MHFTLGILKKRKGWNSPFLTEHYIFIYLTLSDIISSFVLMAWQEIIRHHRDKVNHVISHYTVKSILWQLLNGLNYLHRYVYFCNTGVYQSVPLQCHYCQWTYKVGNLCSNWIIHRDLKPSNILVMFDHFFPLLCNEYLYWLKLLFLCKLSVCAFLLDVCMVTVCTCCWLYMSLLWTGYGWGRWARSCKNWWFWTCKNLPSSLEAIIWQWGKKHLCVLKHGIVFNFM